MMRGVGQRCSFNGNHNTHQQQMRANSGSSSSSSSSSSGSGSPPSSVHLGVGALDSGYTTPSNMTSRTHDSSASSASSGGPSPAPSPNTTANVGGDQHQQHSINLLANVPPKTETVKNNAHHPSAYPPPVVNQGFPTMPRFVGNNTNYPQNAQMAATTVMSQAGTLQKVKRVYL